MSFVRRLEQWRSYFPVPRSDGRIHLVRWILLEGNRMAVAGLLLVLVYGALMVIGSVWTFEMQRVLTETSTVENILDTFLGGIILLVSIVASINSIVLSQDITSVPTQEDRIQGIAEFRSDIGEMTESGDRPSDPATFLRMMAVVIDEHARALTDITPDGGVIQSDTEVHERLSEEIRAHVESISESIDQFEELDETPGADFGMLWKALEVDYGPHIDRSYAIKNAYENLPPSVDERLDDLIEALEMFAVGEEYFKTLYYAREISQLSRMLLVVSLPAILITASATLAINSGLLPEIWILGLPPLLSFVATMFTISLVPYIVLTSYMLRLSTVATRSAIRGLFSIQ